MRLSHVGMITSSGLGWEITRTNGALKILSLVRTITEGLIARVATAANGDECAAAESKFLPYLIYNFKVPFNANGTVIEKRDFGACHKFLRDLTCLMIRATRFQHSE
jgi:hypothetical protein